MKRAWTVRILSVRGCFSFLSESSQSFPAPLSLSLPFIPPLLVVVEPCFRMLQICCLLMFGTEGGVEAHGRCWYLGAEGASCGQTCGSQDGLQDSEILCSLHLPFQKKHLPIGSQSSNTWNVGTCWNVLEPFEVTTKPRLDRHMDC